MENENFDCDNHEWDYKKKYKECYICSKREFFIEDNYDLHVHNWASNLIKDKPKLDICLICGFQKYKFEYENIGDEDFFKYNNTLRKDVLYNENEDENEK